jgi:hypothetical protein
MSNRSATIAVALSMCIGMWAYMIRVANPNISVQAALTGDRAGELGDLYPRWYGTRQFVLHGQNPYGKGVSDDLQIAYYGNIVSDGNRNEQRFAYPVYVSLFLLPAVNLPFRQVQLLATFLMAGAIAASVPLWLGFLGWQLPRWKVVALVLLLLSWSPAVQALEVQQLGIVVYAFVATGMFLLRRRAFVLAGIFLALATIKPQTVLVLYLWLLLWTVCHWREKRNLFLDFSVAMLLLIGVGEWMVPGWIGQFISTMRAYRHYAGGSAQSLVELFSTHTWSVILTAVILFGLTIACFKSRMVSADSPRFGYVVALVLAMSTVIVPPAAPYNHLLLFPGLLILLRDWSNLWNSGKVVAGVSLLAMVSILWPWVAAIGILLLSFFVPVRQWALPFSLSLLVPLSVTALLVLRRTNLNGELRKAS